MTEVAPVLPVPVFRLEFEVEALDPLFLPLFAGSTLRGAWGGALRRLVCMTHASTCEGCPLLRSCLFPRLFEPPGADLAAVGLPINAMTPTPPYGFEPPAIGRRVIDAGASWRFALWLYGDAVRDVAVCVEALRRCLASGLTTRRSRGRLLRIIERREGVEHDLYDPESFGLQHPTPLPSEHFDLGDAVSIRLRAPLRLQSDGKRLRPDDLTFRRLAGDILRRARLLVAVAGDEAARAQVAAWPVPQWLDEVQSATLSPNLQWFDWERLSARQGRAIRNGGWLGTLTVEGGGPLARAILELGRQVSIGKECVFGFGRYDLEAAASA